VAVRTRALVRRFSGPHGALTVLAGLDLDVEPGAFVAVLGASGSGKSTLLHLLAGLDRPDEGDVVVGGLALARLPERALARYRRERVGVVFQHHPMMPALSAVENVALPLELAGASSARARRDALAALDELAVAHLAEHAVEELSGGERQRVALARAVVRGAPLLLVDEPTAGLDSRAVDAVMSLIRRAAGPGGRTVVMATHDGRAAAHADRVETLRHGRLVVARRAGAVGA
jgi:putative ABC transport system ATP-binding protein